MSISISKREQRLLGDNMRERGDLPVALPDEGRVGINKRKALVFCNRTTDTKGNDARMSSIGTRCELFDEMEDGDGPETAG